MNRSILLCFAAACALGAGAARAGGPQALAPNAATLAPAAAVPLPSSSAAPPSAEPRPAPRSRHRAHERHRPPAAIAHIRAAVRAATQEPRRDLYVNATQIYPWTDGAIYRLYTAPEQVSDIALQAGEALVSVAAGDTARWVIGDTTSGAGADKRAHILVKPSAAGLATNLLITTDRRVYHVTLESNAGGAMSSISWTYPDDALLAVRRAAAEAADAAPVASGLDVDHLNFGYSIEGDNPAWRPLRAFDDGRQVYIEFPPGLATGEAPPLFVVGENGESALVNYRLRGRYYVVDRLFSSAELRLGGKKQQVVRIARSGVKPSRKHRGKA